ELVVQRHDLVQHPFGPQAELPGSRGQDWSFPRPAGGRSLTSGSGFVEACGPASAVFPFAPGAFGLALEGLGLMSAGLMSAGLMSAGLMSAGLVSAGLMSAGLMSAGLMSAGLVSAGLAPAAGAAGPGCPSPPASRPAGWGPSGWAAALRTSRTSLRSSYTCRAISSISRRVGTW